MLWNVCGFGCGKEQSWGMEPLYVTTVTGHPSNRLGGGIRGADYWWGPPRYGGGDLWQKNSPRRRQMG
jgi:hypothetical protein